MTEISIFASGRGSGFESIVKSVESGRLKAKITSLICDVADAPVLEKARAAGIASHLIVPDMDLPSGKTRRREHEKRILHALATNSPRFLVLAGYMRVLSADFILSFQSDRGNYSRIVNVHPSLLPAFPGVGGYQQAFQHGCKVTGVTVHLVDESLDGGSICAQRSFAIENLNSAQEVEAAGLKLEHELYPETLSWVLPEHFELEALSHSRRFNVRKN